MEIRTERKSAFKVIGITLTVILREARKKNLITHLHEQFNNRVHEINHRINHNIGYGIFIDPPNYHPDTDPFTWIAGVEVNNISNPPEGMEGFKFPENLYAITTYQGPKGGAGILYDKLYNWVSNSEYIIASNYGLEVYSDDSNDVEQDYMKMELWFPIKKRS